MADKAEKIVLRTPLFRVAFPSVFEKKAYEDGKPKYELIMLFPRKGKKKADLSKLKAAAKKAAKSKWGDELPKKMRNPFRDGDDDDPSEWDGFPGNDFVRISSLYKPKIINLAGERLETPEEFYAGCWAYATVNAYPYSKKGNKGISFGMLNIIFIEDDEPFTGGSSPEDDFSDLIEEGDGEDGKSPGGDDDDDDDDDDDIFT